MSELLKSVDARTRLAGTNKLEILLFTLGVDPVSGRMETFGINVFKVREVMRVPELTRAPEMPHAVEGMVSLRGILVPVIDLAKYAGLQTASAPEILIITEYNGHTQGFLVNNVDTILRLEWSNVKVPPAMLTAHMNGLVTAVAELKDNRLVMLLDVEKILDDTTGEKDNPAFDLLTPLDVADRCVFFVDDSAVARKQIERTLTALGLKFRSAGNGLQAWQELEGLAAQATARQQPLTDLIQVILTDVEMPEMDGYVLTRRIKADPRFSGIPVVMHSSLSSVANQQLGHTVGVDDYVSKFEPQVLARVLTRLLT